MFELLRRYAEFVVRRAWWVLVASILVAAVVATGVRKLSIELDPEKQLPADHPYIVVDKKVRAEFGGKQFVAIALVPKSGDVWTTDVLRKIHDITADLLNCPGIIRQNVASLASPYVRVPVDRGGSLSVDHLMRDVPADQLAIEELRDRYRSEPLFKGTVVSDDERAALVLADFYDDVKVAEIAANVRKIVDKYRSPDLRIALTGQPILENQEAIMIAEQGRFFLGTVCAILVVLYLAFGQIQGVVLPSATALLSTACALGFMGWTGIPMNSWTSAAPLMVVTVASGHSAQMLKRYYEEFRHLGDRAAAVVESTARIGVVMMAAGFTAGSGFAALAMLRIPTLTYFGLGVAFGIFAAVVLEMTFMLALRVVWPMGRGHAGEGPLSGWLGYLLAPLEQGVKRRPRWVIGSFVAVAVASLLGLPRLTTEINARAYWSDTTEIGQDLRVFEKHFPATTTLTVFLEGEPGSMKTPEAFELMTGLQQAMAAEPSVGRTSSIADVIRRTYEVFAPDEAAKGPPSSPDLLAQLFFLGDSPAFERFVDRAYSHSVVSGYLNREDSGLTRRVINRLEKYLADHPPQTIHVSLAGGVGPTLLAINEDTVRGKILNIAIVLGVIFAIASILLRTPLGGAYVTAPLAMALIVNLGMFSWLGIAFDLGGASIAAIGVSIGADYAIYFLYRLREEFRRSGMIEEALTAAMETSGRAVLFVALAISAGFAIYSISDFYSFHIVGFFVPLTMLVSCLTALTLLPALVLLVRPQFIFDPRKVAADGGPTEGLLQAAGSR
jgi:predicted RND superfamily exporter protein